MTLQLAELHGEHLSAVMLVDALPNFAQAMMRFGMTSEQIGQLATRLRGDASLVTANSEAVVQRLVTSPSDQQLVLGWTRASDASVVARALADDMELDLGPGLASTKTPVTVLYPDDSSLGVPAGAMDAAYASAFAALPSKTLVRVDAARQFIMLDQPLIFARALDGFLARTARSGR